MPAQQLSINAMKECELGEPGEVLLDYGLHLRQEFLAIDIFLFQA
jgi:hypothetical protein